MYVSTDIHIHGDENATFEVEESGIANGTIVIKIRDDRGSAVATVFLHNDEGRARATLNALRSAILDYLKSPALL